MERKTTQSRPEKGAKTRDDRLKSALKANLQRRKAQARARVAGADAPEDSNKKG